MANLQAAPQSPEPTGQYMPLMRRTRTWELDRANINVVTTIGKGAFSRVGKAAAAGIPGTRGELTVAVKMLKGNSRTGLWTSTDCRFAKREGGGGGGGEEMEEEVEEEG